jgi:type IV pilus biogenesis protein CpaD/CtpE
MERVGLFMNRLFTIAAFIMLSACAELDPNGEKLTEYTPYKPVENKVSADGKLISPDCPNWTASPTHSFSNGRPSNMGCAYVTNLGLMLEDPRDLVRGASGGKVTPNPDRSADAIQNYRTGLQSNDSSGAAASSAAALGSAAAAAGGQ